MSLPPFLVPTRASGTVMPTGHQPGSFVLWLSWVKIISLSCSDSIGRASSDL